MLRLVSYKKYKLDELADFYVHRRLAHVFVQIIIATPHLRFITPNVITLGSLLTGWTSAVFLADCYAPNSMNKNSYLFSAFFMCLSMTLDCADGQLARATGQTSPLGRFYDGIVDMLVIMSYTSVLVISALRNDPVNHPSGDWNWYILSIICCVSLQQHFILYDKVKMVYTLQTSKEDDPERKQLVESVNNKQLRKKMKEGNLYNAFVYRMAIFYSASLAIDPKDNFFKWRDLDNDVDLRKEIENTMRMLSFLGSGTAILVWYTSILISGWHEHFWKVFVIFQAVVVNLFDWIVRRNCVRLKLHNDKSTEWKSAVPFFLIAVFYGMLFKP